MIDTFGIPLAFIVLSTLLLWIIIGSKGWWWLKALVVVTTVLFSISLWQSLESLQGWATKEKPPEKFEIKWIDVKEPNKKTGEKGYINVWMRDLNPKKEDKQNKIPILHSKGKNNEARLYSLPYSRQMHEQAEKIKQQIAKGKPFYGEIKDGVAKGLQGKGEGEKGKGGQQGQGKKGKGDGQKGDGGSLSNKQDPIFHELPPPVFQRKDGQ